MGSVAVSKILNAEENKFLQNKMRASVKREKVKITLDFARNKSLGLMTAFSSASVFQSVFQEHWPHVMCL